MRETKSERARESVRAKERESQRGLYLSTKDTYECNTRTRAYSTSVWQHQALENIAQEQQKKLAKFLQERHKDLEKIAQERKKKARAEAILRAAAVTEFHFLVDRYREKDAEHAAVERRKEEAEIWAAEARLKARITQTRSRLAAAQQHPLSLPHLLPALHGQAKKASASSAAQSPPGANAKVAISKEDANAAKDEVAADLKAMMTERVAVKHRDSVPTIEAAPGHMKGFAGAQSSTMRAAAATASPPGASAAPLLKTNTQGSLLQLDTFASSAPEFKAAGGQTRSIFRDLGLGSFLDHIKPQDMQAFAGIVHTDTDTDTDTDTEADQGDQKKSRKVSTPEPPGESKSLNQQNPDALSSSSSNHDLIKPDLIIPDLFKSAAAAASATATPASATATPAYGQDINPDINNIMASPAQAVPVYYLSYDRLFFPQALPLYYLSYR